MARSDVKQRSRSYGGGGRRSYGSSAGYNDHGRGASKAALDAFVKLLDMCDSLDDLIGVLAEQANLRVSKDVLKNTTYRYDKHDMERIKELVEKKFGEGAWEKLKAKMVEFSQQYDELQTERTRKINEEWRERQAAQEAQELIVRLEQNADIAKVVDVSVGSIRSDFIQATKTLETYGRHQGDWVDDSVDAYIDGSGFGEEVRKSGGIKLQVTLTLDMSNSMWYNGIWTAAAEAYRTLGLSLLRMKEELGDSFACKFFLYAMREDGKSAVSLETYDNQHSWNCRHDKVGDLGLFEHFRWTERMPMGDAGQDTWIYPLFKQIEYWEESQDKEAARLDIIITDGVLEHKQDILEASKIQDRRDGTLQTVLLNFLPESDWQNVTLPFRCTQQPVTKENIQGALRKVLFDFLGAYI